MTPGTVARQAPLCMGFSRQGYWSGLPDPGDLPNPGIKPEPPTLQADSLPSELPGKPILPLKFILCSKHHIRLVSHSLRSLQWEFQICCRHFLLATFYTRGILLGALQRIFILTKKRDAWWENLAIALSFLFWTLIREVIPDAEICNQEAASIRTKASLYQWRNGRKESMVTLEIL